MHQPAAIHPETDFLTACEAQGGAGVSRCYQCRKCTNGCPLAFAMDLMPNQVMRAVQLGLEEEVLASKTIWVCAACQTCTTRCPNDIDIAHVMDVLRQMGRRRGAPVAERRVLKFHEAVLDSIRRHGRLFELGMVARYKLTSGDLMSDVRLGWQMLKRGKLRLWPRRVRAKDEIRRMYEEPKQD